MNTNDTTKTIKTFHALRRSGQLPLNTQRRADDIDRNLTLANRFGGDNYDAAVRRAANFIALCNDLGYTIDR